MLSNNESKRRVAIYIRVSTQEQQRDGYSLGDQQNKLIDYVENNPALNLITKDEWVFQDTGSGSDLNRPAYQKMMELVKARKVDAVLVWKIDRMSRNLRHLLQFLDELKKNETSFISLQENIDFHGPMGRLIFQIFGALAEFERELIKGRTQTGKIASAQSGNYVGSSIPYGYDKVASPLGKGSVLEPIPEEVAVIERIFNSYVYKGKGQRMISNELNAEAIPLGKHTRAKKNMIWDAEKIETILKCTHYLGRYVVSYTDSDSKDKLPEDEWEYGACPEIISDTLFSFAQEQRKQNLGGRKSTSYLLSGKLYDMDYDPPQKFVGAGRSKGGSSYRRQSFTHLGVKQKVNEIPSKPLEDFVWRRITEAFDDPSVFVEEYYRKQIEKSKAGTLQEQLDNTKKKLRDLQSKRCSLENKMIEGKISDEVFQRQAPKLETEIEVQIEYQEGLEKELETLSELHVNVKEITDTKNKVKTLMKNLDHDKKRWIMQLLVDRVNVCTEYDTAGKKKVVTTLWLRFKPDEWKLKNIVRTDYADSKGINETLNLDLEDGGGPS